jgi:hypothetical protein
MWDRPFCPQPKPARGSRKRAKAKLAREETKVKRKVRAEVAERDGPCRFIGLQHLFGPCEGPSTWQHYGEKRRSKTRGLPPEERHTVSGTMMQCRRHHARVDENEIKVEHMDERGANGNLRFVGGDKFDHAIFEETSR